MKKILLLLLLLSSTLHAEVQKVTVQWIKNVCDAGCVKLLENQFRRIPGVANVQINQEAALATLQWRPNVPFSYTDIDTAMRLVGPSIENLGLRVRIRGLIRHDYNSTSILSLGDNTIFFLLSPIQPDPKQFVDPEDLKTHVLWPTVREELLNAEANNYTVEIEGPLFQPERSPPFYIIVEQKKIIQPKPEPED